MVQTKSFNLQFQNLICSTFKLRLGIDKFITSQTKKRSFIKARHLLETAKWYWTFNAQIALVPAELCSAGTSVYFYESFSSYQMDS